MKFNNLDFLIVALLVLLFVGCSKRESEQTVKQPYIELKYPTKDGRLELRQSFSWKGIDYGDQQLKYDLYLGNSSDVLTLVKKDVVASMLGCSDLSLEADKTYYWKVVAKNSGTSKESEIWKFTAFSGVNALVTLYSEANFKGIPTYISDLSLINSALIINNGGADNTFSSVKVKYGYNVTLYDGDNMSGEYCVKACDDPNLADDQFDNRTSSLVVTKTPVWRILSLILTRIEMDYNSNGEAKHCSYTMPDARKELYLETQRNLANTYKEWSGGQAMVEVDCQVVTDPVTDMMPLSGGYYPHPDKIKAIIDKYMPTAKYGTLFLLCDMADIPLGINWVGLALNPVASCKGATFATLRVTGAEPLIHEWLHGARWWYNSQVGYNFLYPDPHDNPEFNYTQLNGGWQHWYKAIMYGNVLKRQGKYIGGTGEAWKFGGPNKTN